MKIPDYLSPIVGYRVWAWENPNLVSLNGRVSWPQGQPLKATCPISACSISKRAIFDYEVSEHEAPQSTCTCGIYATKGPELLYGFGLRQLGIEGEVFLWGTVVEHTYGWRTQYAYPKSLVITREMVPYGAKNAESFLAALIAYRADVFLSVSERKLVLWTKRSGYGKDGLNVLRQAANSVHRVRVAILSDRQERVSTLAQQVKLSGNAQLIFSHAVLPLLTAEHHPLLRHLRHQGVRVVLFDSQNLEYDLSSIRAIRERAGDVAIIAIAPVADLHVVAAAMQAGADEILSDADVGNLPTYLRNCGWSWRTRKRSLNLWGGTLNPSSGTPPSGTPPPGSATPPTASVWVPWGSGPHPIRPRGVALPVPISA